MVYYQPGPDNNIAFIGSGYPVVYSAAYFVRDRLSYDSTTGIYKLTEPNGAQKFFDSGGRLLRFTGAGGADGASGEVTYIGTKVSSVVLSYGSRTAEYVYTWAAIHLSELVYKVDGREVLKEKYGYNDSDRLITIKTYENSAGGSVPPVWGTSPISGIRYSYHDTSLYLRHVVPPNEYQQMVDNGIDPSTATEAQLNRFAETEYVYDWSGKVVTMYTHGRRYTYHFNYTQLTGGDGIYNTCRMITEVKKPGFVTETFFLNGVSQVMLKRMEQKDATGTVLKTWYPVYQKFHEDGSARIQLSANAAAIASFNQASPSLVTLKTSEGRVTQYFYNSNGLLSRTTERKGSLGTQYFTRQLSYISRGSPDNLTYFVSSDSVFRVGTGGAGIETTNFYYTWHGTSFQASKIITKLPVVESSENGSGIPVFKESHYDTNGLLVRTVDAGGAATVYGYDQLSRAVIYKVMDEGIGGLNLRTDYQIDELGRTVRELGPVHSVDLLGVETAIRSARWNYFKSQQRQVWHFSGYLRVSDNFEQIVSAVEISWFNAGPLPARFSGFRTDWQISATYNGLGIPPKDATLASIFPRSTWLSWSLVWIDSSSEKTQKWTYWAIPAVDYGDVNINFGSTRFKYDVAGRLNETTCPGNTTDRTTYNAMGWAITEEIGIIVGTVQNLLVVKSYEYDVVGNMTKLILPVDSLSSNDRVTNYVYDWRDRIDSETSVVETNAGDMQLITKYEFDNRGNKIAVKKYHTFPTAANLTASDGWAYDSMGRNYRSWVYGVASNGDLKNPQISNFYYDGVGRKIRNAPSGSRLYTLNQYDKIGRLTKVFQAYDLWGPSSSSSSSSSSSISDINPGSLAHATVIQEQEFVYDSASNITFTIQKERFDDATGSGPLRSDSLQPKALVSYLASYPDPIGRVMATANYGTNDGIPCVRSATVPSRTGLLPQPEVNSTLYDGAGQVIAEEDPAGVKTIRRWDNAGRLIILIESDDGYSGGSSSSNSNSSGSSSGGYGEQARITRYEYTSDGWLKKLIIDNYYTGPQVTTWVYGVNPSNGSTLYSNRQVYQKIMPDSSSPSDRITFAYNRQLERISMSDQTGTKHEYLYDRKARLLSDQVIFFATDVDSTVNRIEFAYNVRGLVVRESSYNSSDASIRNEVVKEYNEFNQLVREYQEHDGIVNLSTTLKVEYAYVDGTANTIRPLSTKYPSIGSGISEVIYLGYQDPTADALSRANAVNSVSSSLSNWRFVGLYRVSRQDYYTPTNVNLSFGNSANDYAGYDRFGRIVETVWKSGSADLVHSKYGRNNVGHVEWRQDVKAHASGVVTQDSFYHYDALKQVIRHDKGELAPLGGPPYVGVNPTSRTQLEIFGFDPVGNWQSVFSQNPPLTQTRSHNQANEIINISGPAAVAQPVYDPNGNIKTMPKPANWGASFTCKWDAWNRLIEVRSGLAQIVDYSYDATHRRVKQKRGSVVRNFYFNDQWRVIEEREGGQIKQDYVWSNFDRWNLIRRRRSVIGNLDETRFVLRDYLDTVAIVGPNGLVEERYSYDSFGPVNIMDANYANRSSSLCAWTWLFHSEFIDEDTGLYNYGYRYYNPMLGRWISRDPIEEDGGLNLYAFAENDAINKSDFLGNFGFDFSHSVTLGGCIPIVPGIAICMAGGWEVTNSPCCKDQARKRLTIVAGKIEVSITFGTFSPLSIDIKDDINLNFDPPPACPEGTMLPPDMCISFGANLGMLNVEGTLCLEAGLSWGVSWQMFPQANVYISGSLKVRKYYLN